MGDGCPGDHCPAVIREMPKATALAKKEANQREIEAQKRAKQEELEAAKWEIGIIFYLPQG